MLLRPMSLLRTLAWIGSAVSSRACTGCTAFRPWPPKSRAATGVRAQSGGLTINWTMGMSRVGGIESSTQLTSAIMCD